MQDLQSEFAENELELMAKDMRKLISGSMPTLPKLHFGLGFCIFVYFMCFEIQNRVSRDLPEKSLIGIGYI